MSQHDKEDTAISVQDMSELIDDLSRSLSKASKSRIDYCVLNERELRQTLGDSEWKSLVDHTNHAALMLQLEAVSTFILEVAGIPVVKGEGDLLGTKSDEVDSFRKLPNLRILAAFFQSGSDSGSKFDVGTCFFKRLMSGLH
jgi:hypothetical protein